MSNIMDDPTKSRIAIKFNAPSKSTSKSIRNQLPPSTLGKRSRPIALGGANDADSDDDDDDDDDHQRNGRGSSKHQSITGFGNDGAELLVDHNSKTQSKKDDILVIPRLQDGGWRAQMKARKTASQQSASNQRYQAPDTETKEDSKGDGNVQKWGLIITEKKTDGEDDKTTLENDPQKTVSDEPIPPPVEKTADEEAMDALLGNRPKSNKVIKVTEKDAFTTGFQEAPAVSTLEDYEAMPVEEFGAAMLRGMGWNGDRGPQPKEIKQRPQGLGLGAKELKDAEDLGAWNQQKDGRRSRPRLSEYRQEESKRKEARGLRGDSYKRERERDQEHDRRHNASRNMGRDSARDPERSRYNDRDRAPPRSEHRDRDRDRNRDSRSGGDRDRYRDRDRDHRR